MSRFGWNSSHPRSSRGLYPSLCTTAAATAAAELYCISSRSSRLTAVRIRVLRSLRGKEEDCAWLAADGRGRGAVAGPSASAGISVPSSSTKRPPPPGPPGMYRRLFGGGSVAAPSGPVRLERDALVEADPLGRPRGRPRAVRLGVDGAGAGAMAGQYYRVRTASAAAGLEGERSRRRGSRRGRRGRRGIWARARKGGRQRGQRRQRRGRRAVRGHSGLVATILWNLSRMGRAAVPDAALESAEKRGPCCDGW